MSNQKSKLDIVLLLKFVPVALFPIGLIILVAIVTGKFAPFQTSKLEMIGICLVDDELNIVTKVEPGITTFFICGRLVGETKRDIGFDIFYEDHGVFTQSFFLKQGDFFLPIDATDLLFLDAETFPIGSYELRAAYSRDPTLFFDFSVDAVP